MARIPKGRLVNGPYKPICRHLCHLLFNHCNITKEMGRETIWNSRFADFLGQFSPEVWRLFTSTLWWLKPIRSLVFRPDVVDCKGVFGCFLCLGNNVLQYH